MDESMMVSEMPPKSPIERRRTIIQRCLAIIAVIGVAAGLLIDRLSPTPLQPYCVSRFFGLLEVPGRITSYFYDSFPPNDQMFVKQDAAGNRYWAATIFDNEDLANLKLKYTDDVTNALRIENPMIVHERMAVWNITARDLRMTEEEIAGYETPTYFDKIELWKPLPCPLTQILLTEPGKDKKLMDW